MYLSARKDTGTRKFIYRATSIMQSLPDVERMNCFAAVQIAISRILRARGLFDSLLIRLYFAKQNSINYLFLASVLTGHFNSFPFFEIFFAPPFYGKLINEQINGDSFELKIIQNSQEKKIQF